MGLPPTSTKGSTDSNPVTTFEIIMPNTPISHSGVAATIGPVGTGDGGTGLASPGTAGNVLTSTGTAWASQAAPGTVSAFFASSQVTTQSSNFSGAFATVSNSPAFTFTPTVTGTYKVYSNIPLGIAGSTGTSAQVRIFNTSGGATL